MEFKKIILTRGIWASGKSTWAINWVSEDPLNRIRYSNNDIRHSQGVYHPNNEIALDKKELHIKKIKQFIVSGYMESYYDIVIDNMNLNPKEWKFFESLISEFNNNHDNVNYVLEFKDFFIPVKECIERDKYRQNPVGEKIIKQTWRRYRDQIINIETNKMLNNQVKYNKALPNCVIADMDATICFNISGRPFFGAKASEKMYDDVPNYPVIKIINNYLKCASDDDRIFIITGREKSEAIENATLHYIKTHVSTDSRIILLMRDINDKASGDFTKKYLYETYIKDKYNVDFVLDDSQKIVDMYRSLGLTVLQPNEGKF